MKRKIYFAGSIRGGRTDENLYRRMIEYIQRTDIVLTEHVGRSDLSLVEQGRERDARIYNQDTAWLRESDMLIGECTSPSLGVGYELDYTIEPEFRLPNIRHRRGAVGMAREDDKVNPEMRSGACQFYIVTRQEGTPHLDGKYTVFGEVKEGMEVADSIQSSATDKYDRPLEDIRILSVVVPEEPKVEPKQSTKPSRPAKKRPRIK